MKKLFAIILLLACCLPLMACSADETIPETTTPSQVQQSTKPSPDSATRATEKPTPPTSEPPRTTQPVTTEFQQNMCYWCGELPVGDFETYCVNCRCLKCGELRKDGGKYLYCREHNCNENLCEYPAIEDSQYCSEHKCSKPNCDNRRWSGSAYCAHHK